MVKAGLWILAFGAAWFGGCIVFVSVMILREILTGESIILPEWCLGLLFVGIYFGSWIVMAVGAAIAMTGVFFPKQTGSHRAKRSR